MWYIYTIEYHSTNKRNEIMPFTARWMDLEIITLREVRERQISYAKSSLQYIINIKKKKTIPISASNSVYRAK